MSRSGCILALLLCLWVHDGRLGAQAPPKCDVKILAPQVGTTVSTKTQIRGTATVPPGMFLWVFAHKEGLANWWPQGGGRVQVKPTGQWVADGTFGDENEPAKDAGASFEITAVIVTAEQSASLISYVESTRDGHYPGTQLPAPTEAGCALHTDVIVVRR